MHATKRVLGDVPVVNARAYVSGVGAFEFHVNGRKLRLLSFQKIISIFISVGFLNAMSF